MPKGRVEVLYWDGTVETWEGSGVYTLDTMVPDQPSPIMVIKHTGLPHDQEEFVIINMLVVLTVRFFPDPVPPPAGT